ncbi:DSD1 family PLP-dependent enzyme [Orrella marina]|uniref:Alanine racemase n=1 Tax=Orrella marina TaxID=2163011 RepID=A0A2R4XN26_9BURK|nr:DSD1 family PLP-dependent enzyme [Orrella marina]AWB35207.1 alanine racemase [Orrella marina]
MNSLNALQTPAAVVDVQRMQSNIDRMQNQVNRLGARLRPHVKTSKSWPVAQAQIVAGAQGVTVSTLKEAEQFFEAGVIDILYAIAMAPTKLDRAFALCQRGCCLKLVTDSVAGARAIAEYGRAKGHTFEVWIEIDTDGHRSGVAPESDLLLEIARELNRVGARLGGVMTHAGSSYDFDTCEALLQIARQERDLAVRAAHRLRQAGYACAQVSIGSTPTALSYDHLHGVTEVRAGVYVFFDLVMHNVGVCSTGDIALSVLASVIGHQPEKGWLIVDAGWMAMSRDRGTQKQKQDFGYGQVCDLQGNVLPSVLMTGANQEHGIISVSIDEGEAIEQRYPIGTRLRILPNHACATAAQYPAYTAIMADGSVEQWERFYGW